MYRTLAAVRIARKVTVLVFPRARVPIRVGPVVLIRAWLLTSAPIGAWPRVSLPALARAWPLVLALLSAWPPVSARGSRPALVRSWVWTQALLRELQPVLLLPSA